MSAVEGTDPGALVRAARAVGTEDGPATLRPAVTDAADPGPDRPPVLTDEPGRDPGEPIDAVPDGFAGVEATGVRRNRRKRSATRNAVEWVLVLVGALVVALVVKTWLFQAFYIPSGSMEPTLEIGDRVLVNKISYDIADVDRGDIVVFERPESWGTGDIQDLIKRVVALPGETIAVVDGAVLVDGEPLVEAYLADGVTTPAFFPDSGCVPQCTLGPDEIFVLGDNRGNSDASNHFGPLPFEAVVGRAFVRVWPLPSVGGI